MKSILLILALACSVYGQLQLRGPAIQGRDSEFKHIDARSKPLWPNGSVLVTGREEGLMLQLPKKSAVLFRVQESFAIDPNGQKLPMKATEYSDTLPGYWLLSFDPAVPMIDGLYAYTLAFDLDGHRHTLSHRIIYSFTPLREMRWRAHQTEKDEER